MNQRVLIVSHDYVRRAMAGPAIRCFELARQLHLAGHQVTLAAPISTDLEPPPFELVIYNPQDAETLRRVAAGQDVVVLQGWVLEHNAFLRETGAALVVDLYDPFPLEYLASVAMDPMPGKFPAWDDVLGTLLEQVRLGDYFMCASERQRDLWIGALLALNRINSATYERDPTLRSLIDVVPFGIQEEPPRREGPGLRAALGLGASDVVLLWGGGVYNWFDPLTLIRATARVSARRPELRLVFLSAAHPNPDVPEMTMLRAARELADALGVDGVAVHFNESWVPYEQRASWLLDADAGVSTHLDHAETRFSFRTRILDYLWTGLPILCTQGDSLAELVEREGLGFAVPPEDVDAAEHAIEALAADAAGRAEMSERVRTAAAAMTWAHAAEPLLRFCAEPRRAADIDGLPAGGSLPVPLRTDPERRRRLEPRRPPGLARRAAGVLKREGPAGVARRVRRRLG